MFSKLKMALALMPVCALGMLSAAADEFALQREEFAKYYRQITGKEAQEGLVRFAIDAKVSKSGRDAYAIVSGSGRAGRPRPADTARPEAAPYPDDGANLVARAEKIAALCDAMADLLALHTDYSLWESYQRLDAVEKVRNPDFPKTLFENASCGYCRSHQYELARYWYAPHARATAKNLAKAIADGDRKARLSPPAEPERIALKAKPLASLRPTSSRTAEDFRKVMRAIDSLCSASND